MSMQYSPDVERWRSTVAKYVPSNLVDKVLWVIQYESGGNPSAIGDGGASIGLLQIQSGSAIAGRPDVNSLLNPEYNIQYAAQSLGMAQGNFSAWGEGTNRYNYDYDPATGLGRFGALGYNPYPDVVPPNSDGGRRGFNIPDIFGVAGTMNIPGVIGGLINPGNIPGINRLPGVGNAPSIPNVPGAGSIPGVSGVVDAAGSIRDAMVGVAKAFLWLLNPRNWFKLFFIFSGVALIGIGIWVYARGASGAMRDATTLAKAA